MIFIQQKFWFLQIHELNEAASVFIKSALLHIVGATRRRRRRRRRCIAIVANDARHHLFGVPPNRIFGFVVQRRGASRLRLVRYDMIAALPFRIKQRINHIFSARFNATMNKTV
jgi:hypothetical protein